LSPTDRWLNNEIQYNKSVPLIYYSYPVQLHYDVPVIWYRKNENPLLEKSIQQRFHSLEYLYLKSCCENRCFTDMSISCYPNST